MRRIYAEYIYAERSLMLGVFLQASVVARKKFKRIKIISDKI